MSVDAAAVLAQFVTDFNPASDRQAVAAATLDLIDTLACAAAATKSEGLAELQALLQDWGGKPEAALWFTNSRLPGPAAAHYNGMRSHAVEYDDTHDLAVLHAGITVIPAVIAAAERRGRLSGAEFIAAIIVGVEVACRLARATRAGPGVSGWLMTPLCGTFGAAAGAARALGLSAEQTVHAFGLAYAQVAGNGQATIDGGLSKRMQPGLAARSGLLSAVMASVGLTGARNVFEGTRGYFAVYHGREYDRAALVDGLGENLEVCELNYKPYPCCRWTHAALEAALDLRSRGIVADQIKSIEVCVNRQAYMSTGQPLRDKQRPANVVTSQFSIPYSVALAFRNGGLRLDDFTPQAITRADILSIAERVNVTPTEDWAGVGNRSVSPARLVVALADGSQAESQVLSPTGSGRDPGIADVIRRKFIDCCQYGGIAASEAQSMLAALSILSDQDDVVPTLKRLSIAGGGNPT